MTLDQMLAFAILTGMMALFVWGRLRYDLVAGLALFASVVVGVVPVEAAFSGFGDDIVIIVGSALLVSAAVARSGVIEAVLHPLAPKITSTRAQLVLLVTTVTVLSAFVKNIGALAMMLPVAFQMAKRSKTSPSVFLMPMAFGSLLGGLATLIGTSPNIIVSRLRSEITGAPFAMFDFAPVGVGLATAGIAFLAIAYRLLPLDRAGASTLAEAMDIHDYLTEGRVRAESTIAGKTMADLRGSAGPEVVVTAVVRDGQKTSPLPDMVMRENDIVLLQGEPAALQQAVARLDLELEGEERSTRSDKANEEIGGVEAVIGPDSLLIDQAVGSLALHARFKVNLLAVSRSGQRFTERLRDIKLRAGDIIVLQGSLGGMPALLRDLGCLPLATREIRLGSVRRGVIPIAVLAGAMLLAGTGLLPVALAFFGAALLVVLFGSLSLREAYATVQWPLLVMLGALIPVSEAIRTTGGADLIAIGLSNIAHSLPPYAALALIIAAAMALTPFLNNAATVLVMAPIAVSFAGRLGFQPDAFLMAVAVGAACDFLTPIGHQCNTLVMGPGGYKFGDYARLGAPLSLLVIVLGVPLIMMTWSLTR
ncbi:SLC13 family permease [Steroidobacter agaridevorans]|uniref:SLC13 family permease n=1 Tax=Steroidobacter agaridevorans TaxID=2695856 RepID=UPI001323B566|nr:SLC13 family permease [Steroidobacter agaridevorans]GFE87241.1 permease [Steroidobacter agaridevorans]